MRPNNGAIKLVAGNSNPALADAIAAYLATPLTRAVVRRFADMEIFVEIQENVRGTDVYVIQSTSFPANDNLMELLIIIDALRRASGRRVTAVIPYFGYARQDRKPAPRTPISAKLVSNLITRAGADRVMTLDLHAGQIQGFFDIPTDNLYAAPMMVRDIKERFDVSKVMVVSPDVGGVGRARGLAKRINAPLAIVDKRRERPGESEVMNVIGEVEGYTCILVDDIIDSGGTVVNAADALLEKGATEVYAYITHGVLSGGAVARITASRLKELVITDSIQPTQAVKVARFSGPFDKYIDGVETNDIWGVLYKRTISIASGRPVHFLQIEDDNGSVFGSCDRLFEYIGLTSEQRAALIKPKGAVNASWPKAPMELMRLFNASQLDDRSLAVVRDVLKKNIALFR